MEKDFRESCYPAIYDAECTFLLLVFHAAAIALHTFVWSSTSKTSLSVINYQDLYVLTALIVFLEFILWLTWMLNHKFWLYWNFFHTEKQTQKRKKRKGKVFLCKCEQQSWRQWKFFNLTPYANLCSHVLKDCSFGFETVD